MEERTVDKRYVIALDQGTTSSRAMLADRAGRIVARMQRAFPQIYPQPGWVEHDPADILSSQLGAAYLAGLTTGFWKGLDELRGLARAEDVLVVLRKRTSSIDAAPYSVHAILQSGESKSE